MRRKRQSPTAKLINPNTIAFNAVDSAEPLKSTTGYRNCGERRERVWPVLGRGEMVVGPQLGGSASGYINTADTDTDWYAVTLERARSTAYEPTAMNLTGCCAGGW